MQKENEKMRINLTTMTNPKVLKKFQLPDISVIANQKKTIRNIKIGHSKEMGERYNPFCMNNKTGDYMGRNFVGALFEHKGL